ncbi:trichohyalin isoform X2 [Pseudoliparis swirei]|uniref:trichohyalin isoform X2 n=1 Tax=Pseudoliparis swirei TaxID=2059687 RepID=UPI0024BDDF3C|nr:trichohyalin isoform X2 [Pseudoliparis swirei]
MAAQVEVQPGEVGRPVVGGRLHLSPLTDSSNKSPFEIPSVNQSHIITPEPNKPVPGPKPRLTPKPFAVERNPTIRPILAPKPITKPRPEPTLLAGYKPESPYSPKPQQPAAPVQPRSTNPNRPASTSFNTTKLNTGQTIKPIAQPFKPAPPLDLGDPSKPIPTLTTERQRPGSSNLVYSKSLKQFLASDWSGTTNNQGEKDQMASSPVGSSITRTKSMGFLIQVGQEEEEKEKENPEAAVVLRPKPRASRPRPVSAIFLDSPTKTETSVPALRWARRPLSADLTSKFESIGLSLHRKTQKDTNENTPEETGPTQKREQEKTPQSDTSQSSDGASDQKTLKESEEDKRAVSIKSRMSFLDSSSSPKAGVADQESDLHSPVQPVPETEPAVGVKQLIKQLTEDPAPTPSPIVKPVLKHRHLPLDLTKRFSSERSPDSVFLSEATDCDEISKDPQRRIEESAISPNDQRTFVDLKDSQEVFKKASPPEEPQGGQDIGATSKESVPRSDLQTVKASLFEHVVERHSVLLVEEGKPVNKPHESLRSLSFKRGKAEEEGTLVTATYKDPLSPSSPLRVSHAFDTVQAVEGSRAVSENVPSAQWEDKAMTLRSRRSEGSRPVEERTGSAQDEPASAAMPEKQPRFLRVGALHKWNSPGLETSVEKGMLKETQREEQEALDQDGHGERDAEQEEVAAAPKRLKMLQSEEQPKPRATYFALTGQMHEPVSPVDAGESIGDEAGPFDNMSVRAEPDGSKTKLIPIRWNPAFDESLGKNSQVKVEELMRRHISQSEIRSTLDEQTKEEMMEVEKKRELQKETERHMAKMKEHQREKQRQLELEKEALLEFARMKEREMQREFERQRQKAFEKEKQEFEEKQRALERQKQSELEQRQQLQELERAKLRELEKERLLQLEKEKRQKLERQKKIEREKLREQERDRQQEQERQRQREEERQRELDKKRQLLEIQKEKQKMEELKRIQEFERLQLLEFENQKEKEARKEKETQQLMELEKQRRRERREREEAEKMRQVALDQEVIRMKELSKERERQKELQKEIDREKQREMERQQQRDLERQRQLDFERQELENQRELERRSQRDLERERQRQLDLERQELENQREMERQRDLERERQRQLDIERQELESQRLRQRELEKEKQRKESLERIKEMERRQLLELERQQQTERDKQQLLELEKRRLRESLEREEAEKMRQIAKQQGAERQRQKERQKKEEQERARLESSPLRPQAVDLDSVLRNEPLSKPTSHRSDTATRWKEPSPRLEASYKPAILDIDSFTSQVQPSSSKDLFPVSGIQGVDAAFGARLHPPTPDVDVSWRSPQQAPGITSPVWTTSLQDPWELRLVETSVDKPVAEPRKHTNKLSLEQLLLRQEERLPQRLSSSGPEEQIWFPREQQPQDGSAEDRSQRRSQASKTPQVFSQWLSGCTQNKICSW